VGFKKKLVRRTIKPLWAPECTYADINMGHSSSLENPLSGHRSVFLPWQDRVELTRLRAVLIRAGDGGQHEQSHNSDPKFGTGPFFKMDTLQALALAGLK
jgi:hypothetical protein